MCMGMFDLFKKEKKEVKDVTSNIHNELGFLKGQILSFDSLDFRGNDYPIVNITEQVRRISSESFAGTEYYLLVDLRLRTFDKTAWILRPYDSFGYSESFLEVVKDAMTSSFVLDDLKAEFFFVEGGHSSVHEADLEGKRSVKEKWTFGRMAKDKAGQEFKEMLSIEMCKETGWFELWQGFEISTDHIIAF